MIEIAGCERQRDGSDEHIGRRLERAVAMPQQDADGRAVVDLGNAVIGRHQIDDAIAIEVCRSQRGRHPVIDVDRNGGCRSERSVAVAQRHGERAVLQNKHDVELAVSIEVRNDGWPPAELVIRKCWRSKRAVAVPEQYPHFRADLEQEVECAVAVEVGHARRAPSWRRQNPNRRSKGAVRLTEQQVEAEILDQ